MARPDLPLLPQRRESHLKTPKISSPPLASETSPGTPLCRITTNKIWGYAPEKHYTEPMLCGGIPSNLFSIYQIFTNGTPGLAAAAAAAGIPFLFCSASG